MFGVRTCDSINKIEIINPLRRDVAPVRFNMNSEPLRGTMLSLFLPKTAGRKLSFPRRSQKHG